MLLTVRPTSSWSLGVVAILYQGNKSGDWYLCLLVAYSLPIKQVRNNFIYRERVD